jgi:hypothetical protein
MCAVRLVVACFLVRSGLSADEVADDDFLMEPLPKPWEQYYSKEWSKYYFHNPQTGETKWDMPEDTSIQSVDIGANGSPSKAEVGTKPLQPGGNAGDQATKATRGKYFLSCPFMPSDSCLSCHA